MSKAKEGGKKQGVAGVQTETVRVVGASIPDQITGKWFPDGPAKEGTRWIYVALLIAVILGTAGALVMMVFNFAGM